MKKRYALVGCGGRGLGMFAMPIVRKYPAVAELVGICDTNTGRMAYLNRILGCQVPAFTDFAAMLRQTRPDTVIIATPDALHHEFIVRTLEAGCDAVSEKPMTIDAEKCRAIFAAEKRTGRRVTVTFNVRFVPYIAKLREVLASGAIGKIISVDLNYQLDRQHGADYFRRWHRRKEISGGLLVHKSTHHFDMVNWLIADDPLVVYAMGSLQFYGPKRPERSGRCVGCQYAKTCEFYFDIRQPMAVGEMLDNAELYANVEHLDGYYRDQCVFADEINIEDTMNLTVRYAGGAQMSYSLNAHCINEGWTLGVNGTAGRLEAENWYSGPRAKNPTREITIHRPSGTEVIAVPLDTTAHGGGDYRLHEMLFNGPKPDPLGQMASSRAGAMSCLIGAAGNESIRTGLPVWINDLLG
ncbi:MAG: putative oxidoreductase YteT [Verrucomicrobiae bacterium]|nr:putative oxidoreductase YteT [Verrucomicrobiae bacterium]